MGHFRHKPFETKPYKELISKYEIPRFIPSKRSVYSEKLLECDPNLTMSYMHLNMEPSKEQLKRLMFKSIANKKTQTEWKAKLCNGIELSWTVE